MWHRSRGWRTCGGRRPGSRRGCRGFRAVGRSGSSRRWLCGNGHERLLEIRGNDLDGRVDARAGQQLSDGRCGPPTRSAWPCSCTGNPLASSRAKARFQSSQRTSATVRSPMIPAAVPLATTLPAAITTRRSHCSASSMLWVVTSTPAPLGLRTCRISSHSRARPSGPTPEVGSSSIRSSGWWDRATANATWRCAPSGSPPTSSCCHAEMPSGTGAPERRNAAAVKAPVLGHGEAGVQAEGLRDVADPPSGGDGGRVTEEPDNAVAGPQQAEQQADEGGLAGAVRPEQADDLRRARPPGRPRKRR